MSPSIDSDSTVHEQTMSIVPVEKVNEKTTSIPADSDIEEPQNREKKIKKVAANKGPMKRTLRPDDERTLKILAEKFCTDQGKAVCQVPECSTKPMKCTKSSNLKRHLSIVHPKVYANLFPHEVSAQKHSELEAFNAVQDAIELVTVNGYPFSMLNSSGMRGFIDSRLQAIRRNGYAATINRFDISKKVAEESNLIKKYITNELKDKTISIMFDVCTKASLSVLGVHATYMKGETVQTYCRSLGTVQIEDRHTAVFLGSMVHSILGEYGKSLSDVFSSTTDTANSAVATTNVLDWIVDNNIKVKADENDSKEESFFDFGPDECDDGLEFGIDIENEIELQKVIENASEKTQLVEEMAETIVVKNTSIVNINQINCGTHVVQLAVNDALNVTDAKDIIEMVHNMCLLMRTQIVLIQIRKIDAKIILPPMDNSTRWNSKFLMVIHPCINQIT